MEIPDTPVSLADLSAAGVRLRPEEAATLVRELAMQVERGEVAGVPSPHVIRLGASGVLSVEGPVAAGGRSVERAAQLLDALLAQAAVEGQSRLPGGLKLILARGLGTLDLPRFASLSEFAAALSRFSTSDAAAMVTSLVVRWAEAVASRPAADHARAGLSQPAHSAQIEPFAPAEHPAPRHGAVHPAVLTVSDIRRARRATGLTLAQISERSGIPVPLLRQLEWGYLLNWPTGPASRLQLLRYARAAGLDEQLVVATVSPLVEQAQVLRPLMPTRVARREELPAEDAAAPASALDRWAAEPRPARRSRALALLAIPALLALALVPAWYVLDRDPPPAALSTDAGLADAASIPERQPAVQDEPPADAQSAGTSAALPEPPEPRWTRGDDLFAVEPDRPTTVAAAGHAGAYADPFPVAAAGSPSTAPLPASIGTAMFIEPGSADDLPQGAMGSGAAHLKVTRIVDDPANNFHMRQSPDGTRIAFDSDRDGQERAVYVADRNGENLRRVSPPGWAAVPSWAPDSRTLAFIRADADRPDTWNVWTLDLETGVLRQITHHEPNQGFPWGVSWFPDGNRLAYTLDERLVIHDLRGGNDRVFRSPRKGQPLRSPAVSPDGRLIVFRVARDGTWLLDVSDGSMRRLLDDPDADEYVWSGDGRQLAYYSGRSGGDGGWSVWKMAPR